MFPISHSFWPPPLVAQHLRLLFFFSFFCFVFFLFCIAFLFVGSLSSRLPIPRPLSFSFVAARRVSAAAVPFLSPLELNDRSSRRTLAVLDFHLTEFLPSFPSAALIQDLGILITFSTSDNDFIEPSDDTGEFIRPLFCKPFLTVYFSLASLLSSLTLVYSFLSLLYWFDFTLYCCSLLSECRLLRLHFYLPIVFIFKFVSVWFYLYVSCFNSHSFIRSSSRISPVLSPVSHAEVIRSIFFLAGKKGSENSVTNYSQIDLFYPVWMHRRRRTWKTSQKIARVRQRILIGSRGEHDGRGSAFRREISANSLITTATYEVALHSRKVSRTGRPTFPRHRGFPLCSARLL